MSVSVGCNKFLIVDWEALRGVRAAYALSMEVNRTRPKKVYNDLMGIGLCLSELVGGQYYISTGGALQE